MIEWLPTWLRHRAALRLAAEAAQSISRASRVSARVRRGMARLEVKASVFCSVRGVQATPLCGFYSALIVRTLAHCGVPAVVRVESCHAMNAPSCVLALDLGVTESVSVPAAAA
jgi:hypothetical protein